ncbi:hypothetical protein KOAAANKH_02787 [Brevundimonas sp. NIBR10]|nr:hypothetical protein KOAAANKH_02787 [Brevundimonas sp. NIBR10]
MKDEVRAPIDQRLLNIGVAQVAFDKADPRIVRGTREIPIVERELGLGVGRVVQHRPHEGRPHIAAGTRHNDPLWLADHG